MLENKPITLITGLPGSGKTARGVEVLKKKAEEGCPIFQTGIPELKIPHFPVPPIDEWTELRPDPDNPQVMCAYFTFPENSVIFLSEAQRWFRPRPSGAKVPDHVAAFETVRHTGVIFIFDTQHPDFIDSHVRKLVGQHIHLLDHGLMGRWHYEWPYAGRPEDFKNAPIKKKYTLPKDVFGLYKSASLHIKRKYTVPPWMIILALITLMLLVIGWRIYHRIDEISQPAATVQPATTPQASAALPAAALSSTPPAKDPADLLVEFVPVLPGRPETAPAYDGLRQVKHMPQVVGCVQTPTRCTCQNQQGLDAGLDTLQCRQWLVNPPFNPYRDIEKAQEAKPVPVQQAQNAPPAPVPQTPLPTLPSPLPDGQPRIPPAI